jgi:endonuclease III
MGGIFHSHPYKNYSLEVDDARVGIGISFGAHLVLGSQNTQYIVPYLRRLNADWNGNKKLIPDYLAMMQVYGTRSKSAFLTMERNYSIQAGVVVDRHVAREAWELGLCLVPAGSRVGHA